MRESILFTLQRQDLTGIDLEGAIVLSAVGKLVRSEFEARNIEVPEWLDNRLREVGREIENRRRDYKELRLRQLKARREGLKTESQKRKETDTEIAELEKELA